jgi:hypothetical protein
MIKIKWTYAYLLIVFGVLAVGCGEEEDSPKSSNSGILGTWKCKSVNYTGTTATGYDTNITTIDFIGEGKNIDFSIALSENPNVSITHGTYDVKLTSTVQGQTFVQYVEDITFTFVGKWTLVDNEITVDRGSGSGVATIIKLTDDFLELNITEKSAKLNNGILSYSIVDTNVTFTR